MIQFYSTIFFILARFIVGIYIDKFFSTFPRHAIGKAIK